MGKGEGLEWRGRWERVYEDAKQLASKCTCRYNVHVDVMNLDVNKCTMLQLYSLKKSLKYNIYIQPAPIIHVHDVTTTGIYRN